MDINKIIEDNMKEIDRMIQECEEETKIKNKKIKDFTKKEIKFEFDIREE